MTWWISTRVFVGESLCSRLSDSNDRNHDSQVGGEILGKPPNGWQPKNQAGKNHGESCMVLFIVVLIKRDRHAKLLQEHRGIKSNQSNFTDWMNNKRKQMFKPRFQGDIARKPGPTVKLEKTTPTRKTPRKKCHDSQWEPWQAGIVQILFMVLLDNQVTSPNQ